MATPIEAYASKQREFNTRNAAAIDGLVSDFKTLNDLIEKLQNTPGPISPADQTTLDELVAGAEAFTLRLEGLDAAIPPAVPVP